MTGPDPLEADPLEAALDRYARAFPKAGLPFLRSVGKRRGRGTLRRAAPL